jgi:amidase
MLGLHLRRGYGGSLYARAQNARPLLRAPYDHALTSVDALLMPTTPGLPHEHLPGLPVHERVLRGWAVLANTTPTDMTGHPALTIPAAEADGLPVGVMLIAPPFRRRPAHRARSRLRASPPMAPDRASAVPAAVKLPLASDTCVWSPA